jgi:uncharacterized membrane protein YkvA (DUF1232 family)
MTPPPRRRRSRVARWAQALKRQGLTVYYAGRDPRTPWPLRLLALAVAAYAFSPIDLIPDFIPVLGLLDDLIVLPLGIALVLQLLPPDVMRAARARARAAASRPTSRGMAVAIALVWLVVVVAFASWLSGALLR